MGTGAAASVSLLTSHLSLLNRAALWGAQLRRAPRCTPHPFENETRSLPFQRRVSGGGWEVVELGFGKPSYGRSSAPRSTRLFRERGRGRGRGRGRVVGFEGGRRVVATPQERGRPRPRKKESHFQQIRPLDRNHRVCTAELG